MDSQQLREHIDEWLQSEIYSKPEDLHTKRDELAIEAADALKRLLRRYEARMQDDPRHAIDDGVTSVLKTYNSINREYDLRESDISLAEVIRQGRRGGK